MPNSVRSTVVFRRRSAVVLLAMALAGGVSCGKGDDRVVAPAPPSAPSASEPPPPPAPAPVPPPGAAAIATDADLFALVTSVEPFHAYDLFPNADEITSGRLNGSGAHQPLVRTSLNRTAVGALKDGTLPAGAKFPNGSIVFKEVRTTGGVTMSYAVMYRNAASDLAGEGWLWAEFAPDGRVYTSIRDRGNGCVSCHALERGRQNDLVRTFERQH
jgi:hypothetical protein